MITFKKIGSVLASTAMLTSTVALAAAANFPAPFVSSSGADVAIVHGGSNAAFTDLVAVTDISSHLSTELAKMTAKGGTTTSGTVSGGNTYALFTSSTPIQLNTSINTVRSSVTSNNLPILADSDFTATSDATDDSSITATHKIEIGANPRAVFAKEPTSSDDPSAGILLGTTAANHLINASLTFSKDVNFTDSDSHGDTIDLFGKRFTIASATDATNLVLFESAQKVALSSDDPSAEATINGKTYTIELVSASDTAATIKLTDSTGATDQKEINEAASKKLLGVEVAVDTADETNLKLAATVILGASRLKFTSGSEVLKGTEETPIEGTQVNFQGIVPDMKKLSVAMYAPSGSQDFFKAGNSFVDPVFGGAFKIDFVGLTNDKDREDIAVDVSGNDKLTLTFTNWQGKELSNFVYVNNETRAFLGDSSDWPIIVRESGLINKSAYTLVGNEDDAYLIKLQSLSNISGTAGQASEYNNDIVKFQNVFDTSQTWEADITSEGTGTIDIGGKTFTVSYVDDRSGNNAAYVRLNHPDSSANEIVAYPSIETTKGAKLIFYEPLQINLTDAHLDTLSGGSGFKNVTAIKIPDGDGYTDITVTAGLATVQGPLNYTFTVGSGTATSLNTTVIGSADGLIGPLRWNVTTVLNPAAFGGVMRNNTIGLYLEDVDGTVITTPALVLIEEQDEDNNYNAVIIKMEGAGNSDNKIGVSDIDFTWNADRDMGASGGSAYGSAGLQGQTNDKLYYMMDRWGTLVTTDQTASDQYTSVISYPNGQVTAEAYVSESGTTITGGATSTTGATSLGSVSVTDAEASSVATKNLIVVGGSCVNTVASQLLGFSGKGCGADFTSKTGVGSGQFLIETFSRTGGKVATLVAGFNAGDTTNAAKYLTTQTVDTMVGKKYIGTSATQATLQVSGATA